MSRQDDREHLRSEGWYQNVQGLWCHETLPGTTLSLVEAVDTESQWAAYDHEFFQTASGES